jgi:dihydrofolate reductase
MSRLIVIQFITLDGVVEDPDGSGGTPYGGWAMRAGPAAVGGDPFGLGALLGTGTLLMGRDTWLLFSRLWPQRSDPFSVAMNAARKAVLASRPLALESWTGSVRVDEPLEEWLSGELASRDVVVIGSSRLASALAAEGAVDEYRLLTFPVATGEGHRLFGAPVALDLVSAEVRPHAVLSVLVPSR